MRGRHIKVRNVKDRDWSLPALLPPGVAGDYR